MCFVSLLSVHVNTSSLAPARPTVARRTHWLRLFALLLTLLGLAAQQRFLTPAFRPGDSVVRLVAERVQRLETHAVRAEPALRVAVAPVIARVPWACEPVIVWPRPSAETCPAPALADQCCASIGHFHSKRRIPRMNSEEPPRA